MRRVLLGHVPVDSASVVICDPLYMSGWNNIRTSVQELLPEDCQDLNDMHHFEAPPLPFSRDGAWVAHCSKNQGGMLGPTAVAAATGMGDGLYPVYVYLLEDEDIGDDELRPLLRGRVARIVIDCELSI